MGGSVTFYRQFIETNHYELFVASDKQCNLPGVETLLVSLPSGLERLKKTRLGIWVHDYINLRYGSRVHSNVRKAAQEFRPDLIYTVPGTWLARMAKSLSKELGIPLAAHFMDWGTYNVIGHQWAFQQIDRQFRSYYRDCDLAFCICEEMRNELGPHRNAVIHYPIGAPIQEEVDSSIQVNSPKPIRVAFAGNLGEWYGEMILALSQVICDDETALSVYGTQHNWPADVEAELIRRQIYHGFRPFADLQNELKQVHILLLPMGFSEANALVEKTSFKTKWTDYIALQKPVVIWGPEYCSAVVMARKYDAAECCTSPDPAAARDTILRLATDPRRRAMLVENSLAMWRELLDPEIVRSTALNHFRRLCQTHRHSG